MRVDCDHQRMPASRREQLFDLCELVASAAWLGMDFAWMESVVTPALVLAGLTCLASVAAVWVAEPRFAVRAVAASMACWAFMNSFWMLSDLAFYSSRWPGRVCFGLGLALLAAVPVFDRGTSTLLRELARRFRRLRLPRTYS